MNNRIEWIDDLKVIAIFFVLWGHFASGNEYLCRLIYSFHMPLFFFISGFLFKHKDISIQELISKNANSLLLPYIVFAGVYTCYGVAHMYVRNCDVVEIERKIFKFLCGDTAWYLTGIFFCRILFNFLNKKFIIFLMLIYTLLLPIVGDYFIIGTYFNWIPRTLLCLSFFCLGIIIRDINLPKRNPIIGFVCLFLLVAACSYFKVGPLSYINSYKTLYIFVIQALLGIIAWYNLSALSNLLKINRSIISNVSSLTLLYYILHYFILDIVNIVKFHINVSFNNFVVSFAIAVLTMCLLYRPSLYILTKKPALLGK